MSENQEFITEYEQPKQDSKQISKRIEILSSELEELEAKQKQNYEAFRGIDTQKFIKKLIRAR